MNNQKLSSPWQILKSSFPIYFARQNLIYITKYVLVSFLFLLIVSIGGAFLISSVGSITGALSLPSGSATTAQVLVGGVFLLLAIFFGMWIQVAGIIVISNVYRSQALGLKETFAIAYPKILKYFLTTFLVGLSVIVGMALLVIPGIILSIWFSLAPFIAVTENLGVADSIKRSRELVKGYFWPLAGRYSVFVIVSIILQIGAAIIPYVGGLIVIFFTPYFTLLPYLVFEELKKIRGGA